MSGGQVDELEAAAPATTLTPACGHHCGTAPGVGTRHCLCVECHGAPAALFEQAASAILNDLLAESTR